MHAQHAQDHAGESDHAGHPVVYKVKSEQGFLGW